MQIKVQKGRELGHVWQTFKFWHALNFSGTAVCTNFRFEVQLAHNEYYANKYKIMSEGANMGYVT